MTTVDISKRPIFVSITLSLARGDLHCKTILYHYTPDTCLMNYIVLELSA